MKLTDSIADFVYKMLDQSGGDAVEMQRSLLAERFSCVPSQINYVISTRFTPEHGYVVESRRGGGGYIRITRIRLHRGSALMHVVNSIGDEIDAASCAAILTNIVDSHIISDNEALLMEAALSEQTLRQIPIPVRGAVRADIFKQLLLSQARSRR